MNYTVYGVYGSDDIRKRTFDSASHIDMDDLYLLDEDSISRNHFLDRCHEYFNHDAGFTMSYEGLKEMHAYVGAIISRDAKENSNDIYTILP